MQTTPENLAFIEKKLSRFKNLPGFPREKEELQRRARLLCRLVRNKTLAEILEEAGRDPNKMETDLPKDTNDLELLLDLVEEAAEAFPTQAALRRLYARHFTPPDDAMVKAAAADLAGDPW